MERFNRQIKMVGEACFKKQVTINILSDYPVLQEKNVLMYEYLKTVLWRKPVHVMHCSLVVSDLRSEPKISGSNPAGGYVR